MPSRKRRVTNAHRACACALVIAGLPLTQACKIAGVPYLLMRELLPRGWHKRGRRPSRWRGAEVEELRRDWFDPRQRTKTIASRFGVTVDSIRIVAKRNKWGPKARWITPRCKTEKPHLHQRLARALPWRDRPQTGSLA